MEQASDGVSNHQIEKPKRSEPSAEIQRQIDEAITVRSRTSAAYSGKSDSSNHNSSECHLLFKGTTNNLHDEPGVAAAGCQYEYLNHPADILLHSWGENFISSLRNVTLAMFGGITTLSSISINDSHSSSYGRTIIAQGHDTRSLVYAFLDEWLFNFHDSGFIPKAICIEEYDAATFRIMSNGDGEVLDLSRHPRGMEVKAITYSAMRVVESEGRCDIYVVVDI
eukprot:scaffold32944_cov83-Cyclotella_meneghiniana.AAC.9